MKTYVTLFLLFSSIILVGQSEKRVAQQFVVEWKFEDPDLQGVKRILFNGSHIFVGGTSGLFVLGEDGQKLNSSPISSGVFAMDWLQNNIFYVGGARHLSLFDISLKKIKENPLFWFNNWNLNATTGWVRNGYYYATHNYNDFIKYDLEGNQIFRTAVAKSADNKLLRSSLDKLYLYSVIGDPAIGGRLMQYDTLGNQKWSIPVGDITTMETDKKGFCYFSDGEYVTKVDAGGKTVWSKLVEKQFVRNIFVHGDSIFVCGNISLNAIGNDNKQWCAFSILSAKAGDILLQQTIKMTEGTEDQETFHQISSDGRNIFIGGGRHFQLEGSSFVLKLSYGTANDVTESITFKNFNIYPNPSGRKFTLKCDDVKSSTLKITVLNSVGQVVHRKEMFCEGLNQWVLDLDKLSAGNYTIEVIAGEERMVKRLVVE